VCSGGADRHLKAILIKAGWAVSRTKATYLANTSQSLVRRRGSKKADLAVGHAILKISDHLVPHPEDEAPANGP